MWTPRALHYCVLLLLGAPLAASGQACSGADYELNLKRRWMREFQHRTSISGSMQIRHFKNKINPISSSGQDGDIHFSGTSAEVGLPFVAEIVNARLRRQVVTDLRAKEGETVPIAGAWRLWFEHPPQRQTQGGRNPFHPDDTNPAHSFEIHPVTEVDGESLLDTWRMISGYEAHSAETAFPRLEACPITVRGSRSGVSIRAKKLGYNYVEFDIVLLEDPRRVTDGYFVRASIGRSEDENLANSTPRMVFVSGTAAATRIARATTGDTFRVLGIPRIDMSAVLGTLASQGSGTFDMPLPVEFIIVGMR